MSTRSSVRPSTMKRQPSSWLMLASASPATIAARSRTQPSRLWRTNAEPPRRAASVACVVLMLSHISDEIASRAPRALAHAASSECAIEPGIARIVDDERDQRLDFGADRRRPRRPRRARRAGARTPTPPRRGGLRARCASTRRGCARCSRPARCSGRSSTATPRCATARSAHCCCCCCCWAAACWPTGGPGSGGWRVSSGGALPSAAPRSRRAGRRRPARRRRAPASTHVSFEPPP